ncbi:hypothetical protein Taro_036778 [Colocasia esculenta]|uniref:Uncharacterized protein n=1 Tax=Colocasia esculenta TaxID=4460 RepID=A0A843W406_COLES|nr:hypothetical protein [Colocasia esculenta]
MNIPWVTGGDFNDVLNSYEKKGGLMYNTTSTLDFNAFISASGLLDVGFKRSPHTWSNNWVGSQAIKARLDRVLVNSLCHANFPGISVQHLPRGPSDHAPLLIDLHTSQSKPSRFIFQNMWSTHDTFMNCVTQAWTAQDLWSPNPFIKLQAKLKVVKISLKLWNKNVFGHIDDNIKKAKEQITLKQEIFDSSPIVEHRSDLNKANANLKHILHCQEIFWCQKSRVKWLEEGDRNTTFYHAAIQGRHTRNFIHRLRINGAWCDDKKMLMEEAERCPIENKG